MNQQLMNLEQELVKLKEEMREHRVLEAVMADERQQHEHEICDVKRQVELLQQASDDHEEWQERETQAAEVRKFIGQLTEQ
jgi:hypothetical protein